MKGQTEKEKSRTKEVEGEVESIQMAVHEEKFQQRKRIQVLLDSTSDLRNKAGCLQQELDNVNKKLKIVEREKILTAKKAAKANETIKKQRGVISELKTTIVSTEDELREDSKHRYKLEKMVTNQLEIKREQRHGRRGGSGKWPI